MYAASWGLVHLTGRLCSILSCSIFQDVSYETLQFARTQKLRFQILFVSSCQVLTF